MPDISVIIPAYNRAGLIGETLQSLLNQTLPAKEIIVVDDGSTDGTAEAVEHEFSVFREQFSGNSKSNIQNPTLKVLRQANAGPGAARNRGLAEATGEFIHFFDSDDIAAPNKHEVQLRALLETGADIAYGPWVKGRFVENELPRTDCGELIAERRVAPKIDGTTDDTDKHGFGNHQRHELTRKEEAGQRLARQAGAAFSNPFTSELARASENTSPTRSASGPAEALFADHGEIGSAGGNQLADSKEFLEGQSQAGLQMDNQKKPTIRTANDPSASGEYSSSVLIRDIRGSKYSLPLNFVPEGPVLQARGLPHGDLLRALLTNWSIVPHACLFRRSILEKAGGFPEDIWVGEDQLLFLRCLLAGAKVVHTPETLVFYRLGDDPGKLTATGAAQKRHARDWAKFLVKANEEVASVEGRVASAGRRLPAEAQWREGEERLTTEDTTEHRGRCEMEQPKVGPKGERVGTIESKNTEGTQGDAQGTCACSSKSDSLPSELADSPVSESPTRSESAPAPSPATSYAPPVTAPQALSLDSRPSTLDSSTTPSAWFGFRLRAYEACRDLEKFFPGEETELKNDLQGIWKRNWFSASKFQVSGFALRKLGGLKLRVLGYRENTSFRCGKFSSF